MKMSKWLLVLPLILLSVASAVGQTLDPPKKKLTYIQGKIASLEHQKKTGMYMVAGGTGLVLLSLALIPSTNLDYTTGGGGLKESWVPFYLVGGGGAVVVADGISKWWDAAQQLGPLKAKRYDLGLVPTWDMKRGDIGIALVAHF